MTAPAPQCQPSIAEQLRTVSGCTQKTFLHRLDYEDGRRIINEAADRIEALEARVIALEQVISEEMYPENCDDDANRMLLERAIESHDRRINTRAALEAKS